MTNRINPQELPGLVEALRAIVRTADALWLGSELNRVTEAADTLESLAAENERLREALEPFVALYEKRWAQYIGSPDIAPMSIGFSVLPEWREGKDLKLSDFRNASKALSGGSEG